MKERDDMGEKLKGTIAERAEELEKDGKYHEAADLWESIGHLSRAAQSCMKARHFERAGELYERARLWHDAELAYGRAGDRENAKAMHRKAVGLTWEAVDA